MRADGVHCSRCGIWQGHRGTCEKCNTYVKDWKKSHPQRIRVLAKRQRDKERIKRRPLVEVRLARIAESKRERAEQKRARGSDWQSQINAWREEKLQKQEEERQRIFAYYDGIEKKEEAKRAKTAVWIAAERIRIEAFFLKKKEKIFSRLLQYEKNLEAKAEARKTTLKWKVERRLLAETRALERRKTKRAKRRALVRGAPGKLSRDISFKLFELQNGKCAYCHIDLDEYHELDHVMPLALGGTNEDSNIQLLCRKCNQDKGALHPQEFAQKLDLLL